ncbi:BTAD domain-containing putative transcriptional regulator [Streptomyces sp. NPDC017248]|uniref:BTAD domain-containing putative transcriptional regulator n=1 Tax=unclassified Streptomyces TaxID=2593676 RepID=UPI00378BF3D6
MEVVSDGRVIDLGGSKQRATLGFLLLRPGEVVPVSGLLTALWSAGETPATARKILQNAVWGLRGKLSSDDGMRAGVTLRTQSPGYLLEVDPEHIDLHRFRRLADEGRALLAAGRREEAARRLREGLRLWRGAALADLVELGFDWPELTALQRARLEVLEDYFEAELECGRHSAVLAEIEAVVESEPLRERACGQLMRAMYRCGRQADALGVYQRLRGSLVERLGLEPGPDLQSLQRAVLTHDPALGLTPSAPPVALTARPATTARQTAAVRQTPATAPQRPAAPQIPATAPRTPAGRQAPATARQAPATERRVPAAPQATVTSADRHEAAIPAPETDRSSTPNRGTERWSNPGSNAARVPARCPAHQPATPPARRPAQPTAHRPAQPSTRRPGRQEVSALLVRVGVAVRPGRPDDTDTVFDRISGSVRREIESRGGTVVATLGTDTLGVFPARPGGEDHARRAVAAATALRAARAREGAAAEVTVKAAIVTGEALPRHRAEDGADASPVPGGALLQAAQAMLPLVPDGRIEVCAATREATGPACSYRPAPGDPARWQLRQTAADTDPAGRVRSGTKNAYEGELELLATLLEHTTRWHRQHRVFVLGRSDAARARLLAEFARIAGQRPHDCLVLRRPGPGTEGDGRFAPHRAIVAAYCGVTAQDTPAVARGRLETALHRMTGDQDRADRIAGRLGALLDPAARAEGESGEGPAGWREFIETASGYRPLVLVTDRLHRADDAVCDLLQSPAGLARGLPVLVVAGAEPALLSRRPGLAVDRHGTTVIRMDTRPDPVAGRLLDGTGLLRLPALTGVAGPAPEGYAGAVGEAAPAPVRRRDVA